MTDQEKRDLLARLTGGFTLADVSLRAGYKAGDKFRVFAYLKKEVIMAKLDQVLGQWNWRCKYDSLMEGTVCTLALRIDGEWLEKQGVGAERAMENRADSIKSAATDAFRQAADAWGFGALLDGLPSVMWEGETNSKGQWRNWKEPQKLRAKFKELLDKRSAYHRDDVIGASAEAAHTTGSKPDQAAAKPVAQPLPKPKPLPESPADALANGLKQNIQKLASAQEVDLDLLAEREFNCRFDDLSQQAGAYLFAGLRDGWLVLVLAPMPPAMWTARDSLEGAERAGFDQFALGHVTPDGKHYKVGGGDKPATVWKHDGVSQCDCSARRTTTDAPKCSHIYAVMFWAQARHESAAPAPNTQPAKAGN